MSLQPVLARGVRYRWDEFRQQHQLLFPEGLLVLNTTGAAIVRLCHNRSIEQIRNKLAQSFSDADLGPDIHEFLERLVERGLIQWCADPEPRLQD
ncbi:MAG: pyrroloquinoline quinone biosynthesis peptide chaperone PqqD [Pirellulales bacterium]|nr:pyrroloquinoline quinone biosynthesis peptide chaperone PqqD [Pirellulales bacterium]